MQKTYIADKATQDAIKANTESIKSTANSTKANTDSILAELRGQRPKRYGYRVKESEGNPASRVEYLFDAVGMTPAKMDYSAGAFNYGSWADFFVVRDNFPCMVKNDGTVDYALNPNDYTKKAVTGADSDVANTAYAGNAMSAIPLVYVKRYHENGYRYVIFCQEQYDDGYKAYAHTRPDGTISPYAYGPMFKGSIIDSKLRSISGVAPTSGASASAEVAAAQATGSNFTIITWAFWNLIHDLLVLLGKSTHIQSVFGQGHTTGGSSAADFLETGTLKDKGQFYGYSNTTSAVKVFHMENFWGERWDRMVGLIYDHGMYKAKMTPEGTGYNLTGAGYTAIRKGISATSSGGGYVKSAQQTEHGLFPTVLGGSETTFDADYHYYDPNIVSVPIVGGRCVDGGWCGRSLNVFNSAGSAWWYFGASLFLNNPS